MIKLGKASEESSFKMYQGVAAFNVLAVNPTKAELSKILGREMEKEPEYAGADDNGNKTMRVTFYCKTNKDAKVNNGIEIIVPITFNLTNAYRVGTASGKTLIIDKYGRTAWATTEDLKNKTIPVYSNGPANIDTDYRAAYVGEEFLIDFLIQWLNIPAPMNYNRETKKWTLKENASDSEVMLDMKAIMSGNMKELKELITLAKAYMVKGAVGLRTTDDGKQYHNVFIRKFVKNGVSDYTKLGAAIDEFKANGGAANTEFSILPLHEYTVEATNFTETDEDKSDDLPW